MLKILDEITSSIISDLQNKDFTDRGIFPLFSAPKTARINIVGQAPGLKASNLVYIGMIKAVSVCVNGWEWITIIFIILGCLRFFLWISIILEKVNRVIYHLVKVLQKNGIQ